MGRRQDEKLRVGRAYLSASALPHQQHLCGGPQFTLLAARPSSWHGAGSARRLSSRPPSREAAVVRLTHLLFEHRGHDAHQLQCHSTPRQQRVLVSHTRGVQSLEPRLENSKSKYKIKIRLLHQTRAYGVDRYPHRVFRHSGTSSSNLYFPFTHSVMPPGMSPYLLSIHNPLGPYQRPSLYIEHQVHEYLGLIK